MSCSAKPCGRAKWSERGCGDASVLSAHTNRNNSGGDVPGGLLRSLDSIDLFTDSFEWVNTLPTLLASFLSGNSSRMSAVFLQQDSPSTFSRCKHDFELQLNVVAGSGRLINFYLLLIITFSSFLCLSVFIIVADRLTAPAQSALPLWGLTSTTYWLSGTC